MATTLQRADINDSSGKYDRYYNGVIKKNPISDPFFEMNFERITKNIQNGDETRKLSPSQRNTYNGLLNEHGEDRANSYLNSILNPTKPNESFYLNGTPAKADPTKNPGYNPPAQNPPSGGGGGGGGGSGGGFTEIAPGVSVSGSSSVGWGSGGSAGGTGTLPGNTNTAVQPSGVDAVQQKLRAATDLANQGALDIYNSGRAELNANIENQLRELYIARMMADKALPVQMAAQGINGGAAESTLAGNRNQYQTNRNTLYQDANAKLADLLKTYNTSVNSNEQNLAQQMADLRMQLAIMEAQAKYDKELARLKN
nr:MAG TPA_asm: Transcription initiation factor TFIID subunit, DNA, Nuclear [Caudoviricetes sp.]